MNVLDFFSFVGVLAMLLGCIVVATFCIWIMRWHFERAVYVWKNRNKNEE